MRKNRWALILIGLVLVSSLSQPDKHALVHMLGLAAGLTLYAVAFLAIGSICALPFAQGIGLWVLWRWLRDGKVPPSVSRAAGWVRNRRPRRYRLRLERVPAAQPSAPDSPAPAD